MWHTSSHKQWLSDMRVDISCIKSGSGLKTHMYAFPRRRVKLAVDIHVVLRTFRQCLLSNQAYTESDMKDAQTLVSSEAASTQDANTDETEIKLRRRSSCGGNCAAPPCRCRVGLSTQPVPTPDPSHAPANTEPPKIIDQHPFGPNVAPF